MNGKLHAFLVLKRMVIDLLATFIRFFLFVRIFLSILMCQYPLHHVTYSTTKFEVATSNGLGGDTFTRNVTDGQTTDHL